MMLICNESIDNRAVHARAPRVQRNCGARSFNVQGVNRALPARPPRMSAKISFICNFDAEMSFFQQIILYTAAARHTRAARMVSTRPPRERVAMASRASFFTADVIIDRLG